MGKKVRSASQASACSSDPDGWVTEADRDGGVEVGAADVAERVDHDRDDEAECEGDARLAKLPTAMAPQPKKTSANVPRPSARWALTR
jgi:hypothetical protein